MSASCERSTTEIGNLPDGSFCVAVASRPRVEELAEFLAFEVRPIPKFREDWRLEDPVGACLRALHCLPLSTSSTISQPCLVAAFQFFSSTVHSNRENLSFVPACGN